MYCHWVGYCGLTASEQAAWVQAIGTILTIAVTMGLWQYDLARKRAAVEARAAVARLAILPALREWVSRLERERVRLSDNEDAGGSIVQSEPMPPGHLPVQLVADLGREGPVLAGLITIANELFEKIDKLVKDNTKGNSEGMMDFVAPEGKEFLNTTADLTRIHKLLTATLRVEVDRMHASLLRASGKSWDQ